MDYIKWQDPEQHLIKMVERTQDTIEMAGFNQLITKITRCWRDQNDSLLDHIWVNCNNIVINHFNVSRGESDHNLIGININTKDIPLGGKNMVKRKWRNFNEKRCIKKFSEMDWSSIQGEEDPNVANALPEEKILSIMESEAPMGTTQKRTKYVNWIKN